MYLITLKISLFEYSLSKITHKKSKTNNDPFKSRSTILNNLNFNNPIVLSLVTQYLSITIFQVFQTKV